MKQLLADLKKSPDSHAEIIQDEADPTEAQNQDQINNYNEANHRSPAAIQPQIPSKQQPWTQTQQPQQPEQQQPQPQPQLHQQLQPQTELKTQRLYPGPESKTSSDMLNDLKTEAGSGLAGSSLMDQIGSSSSPTSISTATSTA